MDSARAQTPTELLDALRAGDHTALERLVTLIYDQLRPLAGQQMLGERAGHTLQTTALVNEALIRLFTGDALESIHNRAPFLRAAARAMRNTLVDHARARKASKRDPRRPRVPLDDILSEFDNNGVDILDLTDALDALETKNASQYEFIQLHYFAGEPQAEIAKLFSVSSTTVENQLSAAKTWLGARMSKGH